MGCDSTHILIDLTINNSNSGSSSVTVCDSYLWDGVTYTTNGTIQTFIQTFGCDSIHTLNLTINQSDTSYANVTACDSVVWNGTTYNQSGNYYLNSTFNNFHSFR